MSLFIQVRRRLGLALAVLRGQSVIYRITVDDGTIVARPRTQTHVVECVIRAGGAR